MSKRGDYVRSPEFREKMSLLQKSIAIEKGIKTGEQHFNFGRKHGEEARKNMGQSRVGRFRGTNSPNYGRKASLEAKEKMRIASIKRRARPPVIRGEKHWLWKGGISPLFNVIRGSLKYRQWRCDVFTRDNFTCLHCGDNRGGNLEADHIKPFIAIIRHNEITKWEQAEKCEELWNINNGQTLCENCHKKTKTYGTKALKYLEV